MCGVTYQEASRESILCLTQIIRVIYRELTVKGAQKLGIFHLLGTLLQEYQLHLAESRQGQQRETGLRDLLYNKGISKDDVIINQYLTLILIMHGMNVERAFIYITS